MSPADRWQCKAVSYTHLDVYKRQGITEAEGELEAERLLDAGLFACAEVEAHHRLAARTDALNRHGAELGHAGGDGHRAHSHIATVAGEAGAETDGEQTLRREHNEGRDSQPDVYKRQVYRKSALKLGTVAVRILLENASFRQASEPV